MSRRLRTGRWSLLQADGSPEHLIVGLGNPGPTHAGTRHNIGAEAVLALSDRHEVQLGRSRHQALVAEAVIGNSFVVLAIPQTFMNESGRSVRRLVRHYEIRDPARLVVLHDELDIPVGSLRIKEGGGLAGHNGLRSLSNQLQTRDYTRIRIGIGRPPEGDSGVEHVLGRPSGEEAIQLAGMITEAANAIEKLLADGTVAAMSFYNTRG